MLFWSQRCCTTTDTISPQPWLFLGHLRAAEVAPKRGITERPVIYFKLSTRCLTGWKKWHMDLLLFQVWESLSESQASTDLSSHCDTFVLLHGSMPQLPITFIHWSMGGFGYLLPSFCALIQVLLQYDMVEPLYLLVLCAFPQMLSIAWSFFIAENLII